LNANEMNVKPGGWQRQMHSTLIPTDNPNPGLRGITQDMCFTEDLPLDHQFYEFHGQPKGMRVILEECGLWDESTTCCMRKVLSLQTDFFAEEPRLQLVIEVAGHKCYFLPKFHCELNPIKMYWGWVK
ncbi:hypothetical protein EDD22DRAFT_742966, partial [Suillus occidentalis]